MLFDMKNCRDNNLPAVYFIVDHKREAFHNYLMDVYKLYWKKFRIAFDQIEDFKNLFFKFKT